MLWHLRQGQKDFLPRIGSGIINICLSQGKVICKLSDNTIKSIDLSRDKTTVSYKVIVRSDCLDVR